MSDNISERERFEAEQKLKQAELAIKHREVAVKEVEAEPSGRLLGKLGPVGLGIFVAALGLIGTVATALMQGNYQREFEHTKFEGNLLVELVKAKNLEDAQKNIRWFLRAGLIRDPTGQIEASLENKDNVPFLPPSSAQMSILEDLSHLSYFTPEEQALLDQMKDPVERATFVLQKIKQHDDLIETLRNMKRMMDETVKAISKDLR